MAISATVNFSVTQNGQLVAQASHSVSGEGENNREVAIGGTASNLQIDLDLDISQLSLLVILCTVDATIETNNSSTPDDTLDLTAGVPLYWESGSGDLFLSADVNAIFVTNDDPDDTAGVLTVRSLFDPTP